MWVQTTELSLMEPTRSSENDSTHVAIKQKWCRGRMGIFPCPYQQVIWDYQTEILRQRQKINCCSVILVDSSSVLRHYFLTDKRPLCWYISELLAADSRLSALYLEDFPINVFSAPITSLFLRLQARGFRRGVRTVPNRKRP